MSLMYNWQALAFPSPGPCAGQTKCSYEQFTQWVATQAYVGEEYTNVYQKLCGLTPLEKFRENVQRFMATLNEAKVVKKNQWMRVFELYGVMMILIIISYIIYSIFRNKEEPSLPQAELPQRDVEQAPLVSRRI